MKNTILLSLLFSLGFVSNLTIAEERAGNRVSSPSASNSLTTQSRKLLLKRFQKAYKKRSKGNRSLSLTSISISKDCSAETTCPNGTVLKCSIEGPTTSCGSDATGVACFKDNDDGTTTGSSGSC